jgi:hypothetical protein
VLAGCHDDGEVTAVDAVRVASCRGHGDLQGAAQGDGTGRDEVTKAVAFLQNRALHGADLRQGSKTGEAKVKAWAWRRLTREKWELEVVAVASIGGFDAGEVRCRSWGGAPGLPRRRGKNADVRDGGHSSTLPWWHGRRAALAARRG